MYPQFFPYEKALMDFFYGETENSIAFIREDGFTTEVPVKFFFRDKASFSPIEINALSMCKGRILDVGAGAGTHSLYLQKNSHDVYAMEMLPTLCDLLKMRGVRQVVESDVYQYTSNAFDTIIMLGHGLGMAQDLAGLNRLMKKLKVILKGTGSILCDSLDVGITDVPENLDYQKRIEEQGRYRGEVQFKFRYGDVEGPYLKWLHVDYSTLEAYALKNNMICDLILEGHGGDYLARLKIS
jgi:SAM-dependent methyltransferase